MSGTQDHHKICPYCNTSLGLNAVTCSSCSKKVGKRGKHGQAEKPPNYWAYILCLLAWVGFYIYMRWAFS